MLTNKAIVMTPKLFRISLIFLITTLYLDCKSQDMVNNRNTSIDGNSISMAETLPADDITNYYSENFSLTLQKEEALYGFQSTVKTKEQDSLAESKRWPERKGNGIKFNLVFPVGSAVFYFEKGMKRGRSLDIGIGIIGLGFMSNDNSGGGFFRIGAKYIRQSKEYTQGLKYVHPLHGTYIKPEFSFGMFGKKVWYSDKHLLVATGAVQMILGKQWIFSNVLMVDLYGGLGFAFVSDSSYDTQSVYGYYTINKDIPLQISAGINVGFAF